MDLHRWMLADLAGVRTKLFGSVLELVPPERWHEQADGGGSSIAHLVLHLARHQDLAVNTAIRAHPPLFCDHAGHLGLGGASPGAGLAEREDTAVTAAVATEALVDYATAVFDTTREWLEPLGTLVLDAVPNTPYRLSTHAGITAEEFPWLHAMWREKALWWLVQWPVLGHGNAHVGEAIGVRNRMGLSPF